MMIIILSLHNFYEMRQAMICEMITKSYLDLQNALYMHVDWKKKRLKQEKFRITTWLNGNRISKY